MSLPNNPYFNHLGLENMRGMPYKPSYDTWQTPGVGYVPQQRFSYDEVIFEDSTLTKWLKRLLFAGAIFVLFLTLWGLSGFEEGEDEEEEGREKLELLEIDTEAAYEALLESFPGKNVIRKRYGEKIYEG